MDRWMDVSYGWMDMDGWMDRWMDVSYGWVDGWMDG